jgi:hypothetical protein
MYRSQKRSVIIKELKALNSLAARRISSNIRIYPSTVSGAGLGAFAIKEIPVGLIIGEYKGHIYGTGVDRGFDSYMFEVEGTKKRPPYLISTRQYNIWPYSWTRFINSVKEHNINNLNTEFIQINGLVFIKTTTHIKATKQNPVELFIHYGCDNDLFF